MTKDELDELAHEIAEEDSREYIRNYCRGFVDMNSARWYNICNPGSSLWLEQTATYLEARGLLERHPERSELVRVKERV